MLRSKLKVFGLLAICILSCIVVCISCSSKYDKPLSGYIEGEFSYIASGVSGTLLKLNVIRGQTITQGQLLYILDPEPEKSAMEAAIATVAQTRAELAFAKIQFDRQQSLVQKGATEKSSRDQAESTYQSKQQQVIAASAQFIEAQWALKQKTMEAPVSGIVFDTFFRLGEKVMANQPVLALLAPSNIKAQFYVPETLLSQIHLGQKVSFRCDNCEKITSAKISYISPEAEYTPPVIYSQNTRHTLVYLVKADIAINVAPKFHPGQPIDVFLHE